MKNLIVVFLIACCAGGCGPGPDKTEQKKPETKSIAREAIEGFTGKTAVDNLKRAKPKINATTETEQRKQGDVDELSKP